MIQRSACPCKILVAFCRTYNHVQDCLVIVTFQSLTVFVSSIKKLYKINTFSLAKPSSQSNTDWLFSWELFLIPKTQHWFEREGEGRKIFKDVFLRRNRVMHIVGLKNYQLLHENSSKTSCVSIEWKMKEKARSPAWIPAWFYIFFNQIFA